MRVITKSQHSDQKRRKRHASFHFRREFPGEPELCKLSRNNNAVLSSVPWGCGRTARGVKDALGAQNMQGPGLHQERSISFSMLFMSVVLAWPASSIKLKMGSCGSSCRAMFRFMSFSRLSIMRAHDATASAVSVAVGRMLPMMRKVPRTVVASTGSELPVCTAPLYVGRRSTLEAWSANKAGPACHQDSKQSQAACHDMKV